MRKDLILWVIEITEYIINACFLILWYNLGRKQYSIKRIVVKEKIKAKINLNYVLKTSIFVLLLFFLLNLNVGKIFNFQKDIFVQAQAADGGILSKLNPSNAIAGGGGEGGWMLNVFNQLLHGVWVLVSLLVIIAGTLFDWAVDPKNFDLTVRNNTAILSGWKMVRDFLNLFFILVLLFSAFCTIFQVEKYHLKKLILTIVLMALLVNFSYPIARVIIDAGNVTMYYMLNEMFPEAKGKSISSGLAKDLFILDMLDPMVNKDGSMKSFSDSGLTTQIIAAIVFTFIFACTLLMIAGLMIIRLVVLGIVIIFSPVGFVANIFPATQKYADDWWDALFKQSFFGVIMVFMLALATNVYTATNNAIGNSLTAAIAANKGVGPFGEIMTTGVKMALPIVLLWVGIMAAQKLGAYGASAATNAVKKVSKGAAAKFSGYNAVKARVGAYTKQREARKAEKFKGNLGEKLGKKVNYGQDKFMGWMGSEKAEKRAKKMKQDEKRKDISDGAKELNEAGTPIDMKNNINAVFDITGNLNPNRKITDDEAKHAKAFVDRKSDDQKYQVQTVLKAGGTLAASDLKNVFEGADPDIKRWANDIARGVTVTSEQMRQVTSHVSRRSEEIVNQSMKQA